jgi:prepilin-type processing-associated H-X9-DG protein
MQATNGGYIYWFGWIQGDGLAENVTEGERGYDPAQGFIYPYLGGRGIGVCPAFNYSDSRYKLKAAGPTFGIGYNRYLGGKTILSSIFRPSQICLFADSAQVNTLQSPATPENPMLEEFYYVDSIDKTCHFRHNGRANVVYVDGHVGTEKMLSGSLDTRMPDKLIGKLRAESLRATN